MLAGYRHLLDAAARLQWDAEAISLVVDARAADRLPGRDRALLSELVAGFCVAERAVADELAPWIAAARDPLARECFAVQAGDEARHARFFARVWSEVLGEDPARARAGAAPAIVELFEHVLPATARALATDADRLAEGVGLYHLVLEGIVFAVGQGALLALAQRCGLDGTADGVARVQGDERWHVGLGVLTMQRIGAPIELAGAPVELAVAPVGLADLAADAIGAWGPRIATPERTAHVLATHARRLTIAGAPTPAPGVA